MKYKIGDVVRLKSGGPMMTVVHSNKCVHCVWYTKDLLLESSYFDPDVICFVEQVSLKKNTSVPEFRICVRCKKRKILTEDFYKQRKSHTCYFSRICKECYRKKYRTSSKIV